MWKTILLKDRRQIGSDLSCLTEEFVLVANISFLIVFHYAGEVLA